MSPSSEEAFNKVSEEALDKKSEGRGVEGGNAEEGESAASLTPSDIEAITKLAAEDPIFFARTFFPQTFRQKSPEFHRTLWDLIEGPFRKVNIQVFRGGAKTTISRVSTIKRICYGFSRTALYIGRSEAHAIRSIAWIKRQVESNRLLSSVFGLKPGSKWQDVEAEIRHEVLGHSTWLLGMGITGSIRGLNRDDFRPDLIVLDDVIDDENSATPEQRKKIEDLVYGAVLQSLAPEADAPDAKMVVLQTPLHKEDFSCKALEDPTWKSAKFPCWTPDTLDLPVDQQVSIWPERFPTEYLRGEKKSFIAQNRLSTWLREMECTLTSPETSAFLPTWLRFYNTADIPLHAIPIVIAIDPAPPPSDSQIARGLMRKDFEVIAVVGKWKGRYYLIDYRVSRGHEPDWTINTFFSLAMQYAPMRVVVESVAYQRTLAWLMRKAMEFQRKWWPIKEVVDRRPKFQRIVDTIAGPASAGRLFVQKHHTDFIAQFQEYPDVAHDDILDAVALAMSELSNLDSVAQNRAYEMAPLEYTLGAP